MPSDRLPDDTLDALEATAQAATYPGQHWYAEEELVERWPDPDDAPGVVLWSANRKIEAAHIAAADPPTILALIAEVRTHREREKRLREILEKAKVEVTHWPADIDPEPSITVGDHSYVDSEFWNDLLGVFGLLDGDQEPSC